MGGGLVAAPPLNCGGPRQANWGPPQFSCSCVCVRVHVARPGPACFGSCQPGSLMSKVGRTLGGGRWSAVAWELRRSRQPPNGRWWGRRSFLFLGSYPAALSEFGA